MVIGGSEDKNESVKSDPNNCGVFSQLYYGIM